MLKAKSCVPWTSGHSLAARAHDVIITVPPPLVDQQVQATLFACDWGGIIRSLRTSKTIMNFPQLQMFGELQTFGGPEGTTDAPNNQQQQQQDGHGLAAQNTNDFMRQMQQQLLGQQSGVAPQPFGQLQNLNANALMSAFQQQQAQSAPPGQIPLQGAEQLLASVLAAANNNNNAHGNPNGQQPTQPTPVGSSSHHHQQQQRPFAGLDQLQGLSATSIPQNFPQSLNGLQGLQQQLTNLQHQLGGGSGGVQGQDQQQPNQSDQAQDQDGAGFSQQPQQQPAAQPQQNQQYSWLGQMGQQFHPHSGFQQNQQQDQYNHQLGGPNFGMSLGGMTGINPALFHFQQQQQQLQHQQQQYQQIPQQLAMLSQQNQARRGTSDAGGEALSALLVSEEQEQQQSCTNKMPKAKKSNNNNPDKKRGVKIFPEKLMHAMMEFGNEEAVAWLPDGKSFVVVNPDLFCSDVLSKIFKGSKYASFVRKLHRWGFVRLTSGTGTDCFHHPQFQRNKRDLAGRIVSARERLEKEIKEPTSSRSHSKPPSLAGVEKFIRAKVVAAAVTSSETVEEERLQLNDDVDSGDE